MLYLFDIQGWGKQIHSHLTLIMLTGGLWVNQLFESLCETWYNCYKISCNNM